MSARLTDADLAAIEARANAATEGPWPVNSEDFPWWNAVIPGYDHPIEIHESENGHANIEFIGHARTDVPALLDDLRDARAALERVIAWLDRLASHAELEAKNNPFITLREANEADAKNFRATAVDLRAALPTEGTKP